MQLPIPAASRHDLRTQVTADRLGRARDVTRYPQFYVIFSEKNFNIERRL